MDNSTILLEGKEKQRITNLTNKATMPLQRYSQIVHDRVTTIGKENAW